MGSRALTLVLAFAALSCTVSCKSEQDPEPSGLLPPAACSAETIGGACAGVPANGVCDGDVCTPGVSCRSVVAVANNAELAGAVSAASSGTCLALASGD